MLQGPWVFWASYALALSRVFLLAWVVAAGLGSGLLLPLLASVLIGALRQAVGQ